MLEEDTTTEPQSIAMSPTFATYPSMKAKGWERYMFTILLSMKPRGVGVRDDELRDERKKRRERASGGMVDLYSWPGPQTLVMTLQSSSMKVIRRVKVSYDRRSRMRVRGQMEGEENDKPK